MMDLNKWTKKAQEALKSAQQEAVRCSHQQVDAEHLLFALLNMPDGLVPSLLQRMNVAVPALIARVQQELDKRPAVSGDIEQGKIYVTQNFNALLVKAGDYAKQLKDCFIACHQLYNYICDKCGTILR